MNSETELLSLLENLDRFERKYNLSSRFNIFEAINMARYEIRHSRFLAYLLDPSQPHGLDDQFLKAIILAAAESHTELPVPRLQMTIANYSDARVYCERDHFDITVEVPALKLLFVIENKIGADEREKQLMDYRKTAQRRYSEYKFFGCFLTTDGYHGEDIEWAPLSYAVISEKLKSLKETWVPAPDVQVAINHYVELIEKKIMPSKELIEACKQIYRQHRSALDLIYEHGSESLLGQAYIEFQKKHTDLGNALILRKDTLSFIPTSWDKIDNFDVADQSKWEAACPIKFWFKTSAQKLRLILEVGPVIDSKNFDRSVFVSNLRLAFKINTPRRTGEIYTRILNKNVKLDEDAEVDDIVTLLDELWETSDGNHVMREVERVARDCVRASPLVQHIAMSPSNL